MDIQVIVQDQIQEKPMAKVRRKIRIVLVSTFAKLKERSNPGITEAEASDPALLKRNSTFKTYKTSTYTYPSIRVFFRAHPQFEKLPSTPAPLPLLVFIHGLGGSVAQFNPLLNSLVNLASCLAIDLPGCGLSAFKTKDWNAYKMENLVELLAHVIEEHRAENQGVVLIGHSLGCSLAALLASTTSPCSNGISKNVVGLVGICPRAAPPSEEEVSMFKKLLLIPSPIFSLWRAWDRRGGLESASVYRFVGQDADKTTKALQYRFNEQSKTPVWRRMASGTLPIYKNGIPVGGLPGKEVWAGLEVPVFLVAGEADHVTKPVELEKIASFLGKSHPVQNSSSEESEPIVDAAAPVDTSIEESKPSIDKESIESITAEDFLEPNPHTIEDAHEDPSTPNESLAAVPPQPLKPRKVLKTTVLPDPASHALLYQPATARVLAGLISDFLCRQISPRLDLGWQLSYLSTSGKWDVKNLAKWQAVRPVSEPIANVFRAMKTLREVDDTHSPAAFSQEWKGIVTDVMDISHDLPVYDPKSLEARGIRYHKFPTVSKIPPTDDEVRNFVKFVDGLKEEQKARVQEEGLDKNNVFIGVHCHYVSSLLIQSTCFITIEACYSILDHHDTWPSLLPSPDRPEQAMLTRLSFLRGSTALDTFLYAILSSAVGFLLKPPFQNLRQNDPKVSSMHISWINFI